MEIDKLIEGADIVRFIKTVLIIYGEYDTTWRLVN